MNNKTFATCLLASTPFVSAAFAQTDDTLQKLGNFQTTGWAMISLRVK